METNCYHSWQVTKRYVWRVMLTLFLTLSAALSVSVSHVARVHAAGMGSVGSLGSWAPAVPLPSIRTEMGATTGLDGSIYVLGGGNDWDYLSSALVLRPGSSAWTGIPSLSMERTGVAAATGLDGRIYAIGGKNHTGVLNSGEVYDPGHQMWSPIASMNIARMWAGAATGADGRIYVAGGYGWGGPVDDVEAYDPRNNTWSPVAPLPTPAFGVALVASGGGIYAIGGANYVSGVLDTVEVLPSGGGYWRPQAHMQVPRYLHAAAAAGRDGLIYAFGGWSANAYASAEVFNPTLNAWSPVASLNTGRYDFAAATGADGRIYAIGGYSGQNAWLSSVEVFTPPISDATAPSLNMPTSTTLDATSPAGALYTVQVSATDPDNVSTDLTVSCMSGSGAGIPIGTAETFPIGTTTITCTAKDPAGNVSAPGSFTVSVNGPSTQLANLLNVVTSYNLAPSGTTISFVAQLNAVQADLSANNSAQALVDLASFISHAQAQSGKMLTIAQANYFIAAATRIQGAICC